MAPKAIIKKKEPIYAALASSLKFGNQVKKVTIGMMTKSIWPIRVIRGLSEGYQRVIRGLLEGYQIKKVLSIGMIRVINSPRRELGDLLKHLTLNR